LIQTVSTPSLSNQHTAAACNAVSAFLDAAATSKVEKTKQLALSTENWLILFEVFLSRYEDAKPKPLKQLLGSLINLLAKYIHGPKKDDIQKAVTDAIIPSIVLGEPRSRLKASLVCFELAIRKGAISGSDFISLLRKWLGESQQKWVHVFENAQEALSPINSEELSSDPSKELAAKVFVLGLLTQTNSRDLSGACGNVLGALLQKLKSESSEWSVSTIWVAPVRYMMLHIVDNLEAMSTQILQPIFSADPSGFMAFVESLPLKSLLTGDMTDAEDKEYILLFAALQIGKKTNLVHEDCKLNNTKTPESAVADLGR
jgi:hypothetical protein